MSHSAPKNSSKYPPSTEIMDGLVGVIYFTWREEHWENSFGSSAIEFLERSTLTTSPVSHTAGGTSVSPSPLKDSS